MQEFFSKIDPTISWPQHLWKRNDQCTMQITFNAHLGQHNMTWKWSCQRLSLIIFCYCCTCQWKDGHSDSNQLRSRHHAFHFSDAHRCTLQKNSYQWFISLTDVFASGMEGRATGDQLRSRSPCVPSPWHLSMCLWTFNSENTDHFLTIKKDLSEHGFIFSFKILEKRWMKCCY